ncbi:MAG TPA: patatin family protein [Actinospica sp.]|nr:patatin family protein [Actinospica sp.]
MAGELLGGTTDQDQQRITSVLADRLAAGSRPGARTDGHRVALAIEGGGMRGSVSAGMALAIHELGLLNAFDAVYGASAGALTAAWLLSSKPQGILSCIDPRLTRACIRATNLLRGRPMVDVERLVEDIYIREYPLDYASVLDTPIELHLLATDIATGEPRDLFSEMTDGKALRLALRASTALPVLAGRPVALGGRRYFDAGLAESIPYRQALRDGATHVLVLRSKAIHDVPATKLGEDSVPPSLGARFVAKVALRRHTPQLKAAYLARRARMVDDDRDLAAYEAEHLGAHSSAVFSIRPAPDVPPVSRLATDTNLLQEAFEFGRRAVNCWFGPTECENPVGSDLLTA